MSSAICFNLEQSKIMSSGNGLNAFPNKPCFLRVFGSNLLKTHCFLPVWNLKLSSANSLSMEEFRICLERVNSKTRCYC